MPDATIVVKSLGAMSVHHRAQIVQWLREKARDLEQHGSQFNSKGPWTARFISTKEST